jgi:PTH1 family peptidyl-tRNA hydrolase
MWVIVGLGNPGAEYAQTRHNVGFMVVETVARRWGIVLRSASPALRVGHGQVAGQPVLLAEPQTYMNRSGEALAQYPRGADHALVVVHDDLDLPCGRIRVRQRGGSAGHRGVASILEHFGDEFARVRVGIGRPPEEDDASGYVLATLSAAELSALRADVERAGDAVECVIGQGPQAAMDRFNMRSQPDRDSGLKETSR